MTLRINEQEFKLLRSFIEQECGIVLGDGKAYLVENRLSDLAKKSGCQTFGEFYLKVKTAPAESLIRRSMVDAITTNETYWFRDQYPFRVLRERLLPELCQELREGKRKKINIWSAGCSTGQEPYSIAMTALDFYKGCGYGNACREEIKILATDVSHASLAIAAAGRYDSNSMSRGLPTQYFDLYFRKEDRSWIIREELKSLVTFNQFNLRDLITQFGSFDVVFLRNVIIYFSDAFKRDLFYKMARILSPKGCLFLGTGETVTGYSPAFEMVEDKGCILYRVKSGSGTG